MNDMKQKLEDGVILQHTPGSITIAMLGLLKNTRMKIFHAFVNYTNEVGMRMVEQKAIVYLVRVAASEIIGASASASWRTIGRSRGTWEHQEEHLGVQTSIFIDVTSIP